MKPPITWKVGDRVKHAHNNITGTVIRLFGPYSSQGLVVRWDAESGYDKDSVYMSRSNMLVREHA